MNLRTIYFHLGQYESDGVTAYASALPEEDARYLIEMNGGAVIASASEGSIVLEHLELRDLDAEIEKRVGSVLKDLRANVSTAEERVRPKAASVQAAAHARDRLQKFEARVERMRAAKKDFV